MSPTVLFWQHITSVHVLALAAAVAACRPSLLPRSLPGQVIAVTGATSLVAGVVALMRLVLGDRPIWGVVAVLAVAIPRTGRLTGLIRTLLLLLAATALVDAGLAAMANSVPFVQRRFNEVTAHLYPQIVLALAGIVTGVFFVRFLLAQRRFAKEAGAAKPSVGTFVLGPLGGAAVIAYVYLLVWVAREWVMRDYIGFPLAMAIVLATLGGAAVVGILGLAAAFRWYQRKVDAFVDPRFTEPLELGDYLGGWTEADVVSLGPGGRQFLQGRVAAERIAEVTETPAVEPVRIYVGRKPRFQARLWSPQTQVDRVARALDDTVARKRRYLILAAPTGSGAIDNSAIDAFEYLTGGDCATVVVGYSALPSVLALLLRQTGRKTYPLLYQQGVPNPQIILYGESLGALVSQHALRAHPLESVKALWVGTPKVADTPDDPGVRRITGGARHERRGARSIRYLLLDHTDDPVTQLDLGLLVSRGGYPAPWLPIVTFCQVIGDTFSALRPAPSGQAGHGHDYRADVGPAVALLLAATGAPAPADEVVAAVSVAMVQRERTRVDGPVNASGLAGPPRLRPVTELRVHGVGGETPERTVNYPLVHRVAGDDMAGFYRAGTNEVPVTDPLVARREAYNWGGLVDGFWQRVLWVLLLPFALINVATWMVPPGENRSRVRAAITAVLRVQGMLMTLALTVTLWGVGGYLTGWTCPRDDTCGAAPGSFGDTLAVPGLFTVHLTLPREAGWRAAVSLIPALVVLLVLFQIGRATRIKYENWPAIYPERLTRSMTERVRMPAGSLADRDFWHGSVAVARLQVVHLAGGLAAGACLLIYPAFRAHVPGTGWLVGASGALIVAAIAATAPHRWVGRRRSDRSGAVSDDRVEVALQSLLGLSVAVLATVIITVAHRWPGARACETNCTRSALPGFGSVFDWAVWAQAACVAAVLVLLVIGTVWKQPATPPEGYAPVQRGFVCATTAGIASLVGALLGTGLILVAARSGDGDVTDGVPAGIHNAAMVGTVSLIAGFVVVGFLSVVARFVAGVAKPAVIADYGRGGRVGAPLTARGSGEPIAIDRRRGQIAGRWATGWLVDNAANGAAVVLVVAVVALVTARWWGSTETEIRHWSVRLVAVLAFALLTFAYGAVRGGRRSPVATLFDVSTVWPRAAHPFAPPCYAERAVPELVNRIEALLSSSSASDTGFSSRSLVLVGYSQGSVLTVAALEQLAPYLEPDRIGLVTCGSPLRRLYARYYPAYFTPELLAAHPNGHASTLAGLKRAELWRNVYRPSDPIGSWLHEDLPAGARPPRPQTIDRRLLDPAGFGPPAGDLALPPIRGHGGYFTDLGLTRHVNEVADRLSPPVPGLRRSGTAVSALRMVLRWALRRRSST